MRATAWSSFPNALLIVAVASPLPAQLVLEGAPFTAANLGSSIQTGDELGYALAVGDFDGDSYDDLAVGLPGRTVNGHADAGAVIVVYGSINGLNGAGARPPILFHQDTTNVLETAEDGDRFGAALIAADFDDDNADDLAVGVPFEDLESAPSVADAGLVQIFYGTLSGLDPADDQTFQQESFTMLSNNESGDQFGYALSACDFSFPPDGFVDLIIGAPGDNIFGLNDSGAGFTVFSSGSGLSATGAAVTGVSGFATPPAAGDRSMSALACLDFNSGNAVAIAVGAPFAEAAGYGNSAGIVRIAASNASPYEAQSPFAGSQFGTSLAIAPSVYGGGYDIYGGLPGFDVSSQDEAGAALSAFLSPIFTQGARGLGETPEAADHFGKTIAVGDFNGDDQDDLAIGAPDENLDDTEPQVLTDAGTVMILFSQSGRIGTAAHQNANFQVTAFGAFANDHFGGALAAGDFDGDGVDDLAVSAPTALISSTENGLVQIFYGEARLLFADNFENFDVYQLTPWSGTGP